jgi:predicted Ser/Thr protein kinase
MTSPMPNSDAKDRNADDVSLVSGAILRSRYVLEEEIGRGGQCVVFRAIDLHRVTQDDPSAGRIALKLVHPLHSHDERAVTRLAREFRLMQALAHPGIARVFDLDCDRDIWFISMELIDGQPLDHWMREDIPLRDALQTIESCCEALDYAHSMGVVHGDLKPSNVLRCADGRIKLIDFGSVDTRNVGLQAQHSAADSSTPAFASAQVLAGLRAEVQDDVFSVAALSYALLSEGARPFGDKSSLEAHRARLCPAIIEGMPVELFAVLARSLAGDRVHRPASAGEFFRDLIQGGGADATTPARHSIRAARGSQNLIRRVSFASVMAAALCAAVMLLPVAQRLIAGPSSNTSSEEIVRAVSSAAVPAAAASVVPGAANLSPAGLALALGAADDSAAPAAASVSGIVTFESASLVAGSAQSMVAIPIRRLQSTRSAAAVEWQIESGSARPEVDYEPIKPQVIRFSEGQSVRSLFIPLVRTAADTETRPPRSFTVQLRAVGREARLGAVSRIKVTIVPQPIYSDLGDKVALK